MNDDLNFEFGMDVGVARGCGATLMGEFWYFGGSGPTVRQVLLYDQVKTKSVIKASKIEDCRLTRQADLGFDFQYGSCNTFLQPTPKILLCFHYFDIKTCHS